MKWGERMRHCEECGFLGYEGYEYPESYCTVGVQEDDPKFDEDKEGRLRNDPEAEWVEIVRCKDCINWDTTWTNDWTPNYHYCPIIDGVRKDNFYCADAERRTDVDANT